jgi:NAD(P)H-dependent FMN reductase
MPAKQQRIAVVIGSTRPTRICAGIAAWACEAIGKDSELRYELLDLAEAGLPFLDEPLKAALGDCKHDHTKAWSRTVQSYDGFLFVFPQYNWGYPAVLKNALDYLYREWRDKPASFITYGTRGGIKAAEQFTGVLQGLRMRVLDHAEAFITDDDVDEDWQLKHRTRPSRAGRAEMTSRAGQTRPTIVSSAHSSGRPGKRTPPSRQRARRAPQPEQATAWRRPRRPARPGKEIRPRCPPRPQPTTQSRTKNAHHTA